MVNMQTKNNRAFTLIEMIVAMGIFVVTLSIASGGFLSVVRAQRAASALMAISDSMNITIEQMMREMRTSYNFCTSDSQFFARADCRFVPEGGVQFVNANNIVVRYILDSPSGAINRCIGNVAGGGFTCAPITAENVSVSKFITDLSGALRDDKRPPRVTMRFQITSADTQIKLLGISMSIQTTVSARCGPASLETETPELSCPAET